MRKKTFVEKFLLKFSADDTTTLAASLAFYAVLSLAPLLILFVTISANFSDRLQARFLTEAHQIMGDDAAKAVEMIIESAKDRPDLTSVASTMGVLTLLISSSLIFGQLRSTLNRIFGVHLRSAKGESMVQLGWGYFKERLFHVGLALGFIFTLIASLVVSSIISSPGHAHSLLYPVGLNLMANLVFYFLTFTLLFRFMPDRRLPWTRAAQGGGLTAVLFVVGKELIGLYLAKSAVGSSYGAAGSVIVLLVWVYYSSLITFIGAQVSWLLHQAKIT